MDYKKDTQFHYGEKVLIIGHGFYKGNLGKVVGYVGQAVFTDKDGAFYEQYNIQIDYNVTRPFPAEEIIKYNWGNND